MKIISLIKKGDTSKEIAASLQLAVKTVEVLCYNILKNLKLKNSVALVAYMNKQSFV